MDRTEIKELSLKWDALTHRVLNLETLTPAELHPLVRDSYRAVSHYCKKEEVPKEITALFLQIEDFLYFASLMEEKEKSIDFYFWEELHYMEEALKKGFFDGGFPEAYPVLLVTDALDNSYRMNFEENSLEDYIHTVNQQKSVPN